MPEPIRPATQTRRNDLAARLVDVAEAQIAASGLSELRARGLAERAGCSVGAIYGVFPDLDELVLAVNARTLAGIEAALAPGSEHDVMAGPDPAIHAVPLPPERDSTASQGPSSEQRRCVDHRIKSGDDGVSADVDGGSSADQLVHLADAYLAYAAANRPRWTALFQHRMAERPLPDWYAARRRAAFAPIEAPLARLRPDLPPGDLAALSGSLFAAVHGMVALGLDELLGALPLAVLREQIRVMVMAMATGLVAHEGGSELAAGPSPNPLPEGEGFPTPSPPRRGLG